MEGPKSGWTISPCHVIIFLIGFYCVFVMCHHLLVVGKNCHFIIFLIGFLLRICHVLPFACSWKKWGCHFGCTIENHPNILFKWFFKKLCKPYSTPNASQTSKCITWDIQCIDPKFKFNSQSAKSKCDDMFDAKIAYKQQMTIFTTCIVIILALDSKSKILTKLSQNLNYNSHFNSQHLQTLQNVIII